MVTIEDIEARLGEDIPEDVVAKVQILIEDAVSTVLGYIGREIPDPMPDAIRAVVGRMVVRALKQSDGGVDAPAGATGMMNVAGSFTRQINWAAGANDGGVWLSSQDKIMLRPYKRRRGIQTVPYDGMV